MPQRKIRAKVLDTQELLPTSATTARDTFPIRMSNGTYVFLNLHASNGIGLNGFWVVNTNTNRIVFREYVGLVGHYYAGRPCKVLHDSKEKLLFSSLYGGGGRQTNARFILDVETGEIEVMPNKEPFQLAEYIDMGLDFLVARPFSSYQLHCELPKSDLTADLTQVIDHISTVSGVWGNTIRVYVESRGRDEWFTISDIRTVLSTANMTTPTERILVRYYADSGSAHVAATSYTGYRGMVQSAYHAEGTPYIYFWVTSNNSSLADPLQIYHLVTVNVDTLSVYTQEIGRDNVIGGTGWRPAPGKMYYDADLNRVFISVNKSPLVAMQPAYFTPTNGTATITYPNEGPYYSDLPISWVYGNNHNTETYNYNLTVVDDADKVFDSGRLSERVSSNEWIGKSYAVYKQTSGVDQYVEIETPGPEVVNDSKTGVIMLIDVIGDNEIKALYIPFKQGGWKVGSL